MISLFFFLLLVDLIFVDGDLIIIPIVKRIKEEWRKK